MDAEAKRIMAVSISKLYSSRTQRGGLRLHRSLLLSMTMRAARDIYHAAVQLRQSEDEQVVPCAPEEPMDTKEQVSELTVTPKEVNPHEPKDILEEDKENRDTSERHSRKRRGKTALEPDFLPLKKARMDTDEDRQYVQSEVLKPNNGLTAFPLNRAITAY
ncbi:immediate early response 2b [Misgurnus anguillicaudatus]|uniref:immediate early response 2b n=1 Tax=Misgurnus anguillicaudatus TaxID=75329 RepID=UPI003CCFDF97